MALSEAEYRYVKRQRGTKVTMTRLIREMIEHATAEAAEANDSDDPGMGYREHVELIDAYRAGLMWWTNHDGGYDLYQIWREYLAALRSNGFDGQGSGMGEAFEEEGI